MRGEVVDLVELRRRRGAIHRTSAPGAELVELPRPDVLRLQHRGEGPRVNVVRRTEDGGRSYRGSLPALPGMLTEEGPIVAVTPKMVRFASGRALRSRTEITENEALRWGWRGAEPKAVNTTPSSSEASRCDTRPDDFDLRFEMRWAVMDAPLPVVEEAAALLRARGIDLPKAGR